MIRESFVITLRPEPGVAGLQSLRLALKALLRHGLRCTRIEIVLPDDPPMLRDGTPERVAAPELIHSGHKYGDASRKEKAAPKRGSSSGRLMKAYRRNHGRTSE